MIDIKIFLLIYNVKFSKFLPKLGDGEYGVGCFISSGVIL